MEEIVLVNQSGKAIGRAPKLESHHSKTPLHLAFSCYIFNSKGQFLLTKRALSKKVWPGVWSNSVCGHPAPGETFPDAIKRRAKFELGLEKIQNLKLIFSDYIYKTPPFKGVVEHEYCPIYTALTDAKPKLNSSEVKEYMWVNWDEALEDIKKNPEKFSYWFKDQLSKHKFSVQ